MSQSPDFEALWRHFLAQFAAQVPGFKLDAHNESVYRRLLAHFAGDAPTQTALGLDPGKGILLLGPVGCGKTAAMRFFERNARTAYRVVPARDVARRFLTEGFAVLDRYGAQAFMARSYGAGHGPDHRHPVTYCFDDLGVEQNARLYGNECNVLAEILLDRYDRFVTHRMRTHLTSNLNASELETLYGDRLRSRLREMCNVLSFPTTAPDRRR
ncbi:ATPase [Hymenobacter sp.]|uniref:ATPase n=1 Tax=Hymenobacter sp. TaxID=1898978 RepID=UPI00286AA017|nr:ATPase [Hymenobacter sp.]